MYNKKGLSLIALIITIIVMVALSAIVVNISFNVFDSTTGAKFKHSLAEARDRLDLYNLEALVTNISYKKEYLQWNGGGSLTRNFKNAISRGRRYN